MARGERTSDAVLGFADEMRGLILAGDRRVRLLGSRERAHAVIDEFSSRPAAAGVEHAVGPADQGRRSSTRRPTPSAAPYGTDLRLVAPLRAFRRRPLNVHIHSPVRVGAVPYPLLVVDELALLAGPLGTAFADTVWAVQDPDLVERAARAYLAVWDAAVPLAESEAPRPLPPRTLEVALRLVDGMTDREIAAQLGVSERTVSAEVNRVVEWVGARSRGHAVALLVGAG